MSLKKELVEVCHKVYEKGFVAAYDGNISLRSSQDTILITRSGICKGNVTEDDIIEIDLDGKTLDGNFKISTESKMHLFIYSKRKDVNAVVHCHPVYATAFALLEDGMLEHFFPEVLLTLGKIPLCKYATPSTEEVTKSIQPFVEHSWAMLLQNHGAVTLGTSLWDAYFKMEKLEHAAKTIAIAKNIGSPNPLSKNSVNKLVDISETTYNLKIDKRNI